MKTICKNCIYSELARNGSDLYYCRHYKHQYTDYTTGLRRIKYMDCQTMQSSNTGNCPGYIDKETVKRRAINIYKLRFKNEPGGFKGIALSTILLILTIIFIIYVLSVSF